MEKWVGWRDGGPLGLTSHSTPVFSRCDVSFRKDKSSKDLDAWCLLHLCMEHVRLFRVWTCHPKVCFMALCKTQPGNNVAGIRMQSDTKHTTFGHVDRCLLKPNPDSIPFCGPVTPEKWALESNNTKEWPPKLYTSMDTGSSSLIIDGGDICPNVEPIRKRRKPTTIMIKTSKSKYLC